MVLATFGACYLGSLCGYTNKARIEVLYFVDNFFNDAGGFRSCMLLMN